jgi:hypothetical protein
MFNIDSSLVAVFRDHSGFLVECGRNNKENNSILFLGLLRTRKNPYLDSNSDVLLRGDFIGISIR